MTSLTKEVCLVCTKYITTGQFIVECCKCDGAMHHKCFKKSNLSTLSEDFYCSNCSHLAVFRYNPFRLDIDTDENTDVDDIIVKVDQILKNCNSYDTKNFKGLDASHDITGTRSQNYIS